MNCVEYDLLLPDSRLLLIVGLNSTFVVGVNHKLILGDFIQVRSEVLLLPLKYFLHNIILYI